jgi:threonine/homoserine/homoserine lactone efflux protein
VFGGLFVLLASCTDSLYALLGSTVGKLLTRNARFRQGQQYVMGGVYIVLGVTAAVTGSEHK